ncbi:MULTISPECIES: hypothetical protein [Asticcacaulis]|uniref:hypothetical protein n=1 Tax=Asticcacaulis TaxID=76890 RepID=UPI001AE900B1|nr:MULTISPECIES: hypothetical protein [Asticcacaulis]MBP2158234.1 hypothetical protein [Asticcacaulis solisilvae]MDR6799279.1 hypothetical protein [Asticcacaulis sp. BE141]
MTTEQMMALTLVGVVFAVLGLTIYISRPNWPYHTGGAGGYIRDLVIYTFLPALPAFVAVIGFRVYAMLQPVSVDMTVNYVLIGVALLGLVVMRRMPFVTAAQNRVRAARAARYQAMGS